MTGQFETDIEQCEKLLIGIGGEWEFSKQPDIREVYEKLSHLIEKKDYFIVTTVVDGVILESSLDARRITAPCGNTSWRQCSKSCTKDIWEKDEIPDDSCPHCGAPLTGNTIEAENYIEEGYLPQWNAYKTWLSGTLNKELLALELGVGFKTPTVIRWPFEKTVYFNKKAYMYRINQRFAQVSEEIRDKMTAISENSVEYFRKL